MNVDRQAVGLPPIEKPNTITITLEEYKELLTIKGRYEELKTMYYPTYLKTNITYRGLSEPTEYELYREGDK